VRSLRVAQRVVIGESRSCGHG